MRITGGTLRGRTLKAPDGMGTRPTADRVREALFNIIAHHDWGEEIGKPLLGTHVLDAFAGTGALGLEAISRGAASCSFFENDRKALQALRENIAHTKTDEVAQIIQMDVTRAPRFTSASHLQNEASVGVTPHALRGPEQQTPPSVLCDSGSRIKCGMTLKEKPAPKNKAAQPAALVFLDPPYHKGLIERAVAALTAQGWIAPHALLVCETAKDEELTLPDCEELLSRTYGDTKIRFFTAQP